jgi:hypothetical protein
MATVNRRIALVMLNNNGIYPGDPQVLSVYQYNNDFNGDKAYAILYNAREFQALIMSPAVHNPVELWSRDQGLTEEGLKLVKEEDNGKS